MIDYEPCKYIQEASLKQKRLNSDGTYTYYFSIPTLLPLTKHNTPGYIIRRERLANKKPNLIPTTKKNVVDHDDIIIDCNDPDNTYNVGDKFLIACVGGDPTRIHIIGRL